MYRRMKRVYVKTMVVYPRVKYELAMHVLNKDLDSKIPVERHPRDGYPVAYTKRNGRYKRIGYVIGRFRGYVIVEV